MLEQDQLIFSNNGLLNHRETLFDIDCAENLNTIDSLIKSSIEMIPNIVDYEFSQDEENKT